MCESTNHFSFYILSFFLFNYAPPGFECIIPLTPLYICNECFINSIKIPLYITQFAARLKRTKHREITTLIRGQISKKKLTTYSSNLPENHKAQNTKNEAQQNKECKDHTYDTPSIFTRFHCTSWKQSRCGS